jgi:hypothetical protein
MPRKTPARKAATPKPSTPPVLSIASPSPSTSAPPVPSAIELPLRCSLRSELSPPSDAVEFLIQSVSARPQRWRTTLHGWQGQRDNISVLLPSAVVAAARSSSGAGATDNDMNEPVPISSLPVRHPLDDEPVPLKRHRTEVVRETKERVSIMVNVVIDRITQAKAKLPVT